MNVHCSLMAWGGSSHPTLCNSGTTNLRQVSASVNAKRVPRRGLDGWEGCRGNPIPGRGRGAAGVGPFGAVAYRPSIWRSSISCLLWWWLWGRVPARRFCCNTRNCCNIAGIACPSHDIRGQGQSHARTRRHHTGCGPGQANEVVHPEGAASPGGQTHAVLPAPGQHGTRTGKGVRGGGPPRRPGPGRLYAGDERYRWWKTWRP